MCQHISEVYLLSGGSRSLSPFQKFAVFYFSIDKKLFDKVNKQRGDMKCLKKYGNRVGKEAACLEECNSSLDSVKCGT
jgi:hypothetical protein